MSCNHCYMISSNDAVTSNVSLFPQNEHVVHGIACGNSFHLYTFLLKTFHFPGYCQAYHCNDLNHLTVYVFSRTSGSEFLRDDRLL